jgi:hypothetical protein
MVAALSDALYGDLGTLCGEYGHAYRAYDPAVALIKAAIRRDQSAFGFVDDPLNIALNETDCRTRIVRGGDDSRLAPRPFRGDR